MPMIELLPQILNNRAGRTSATVQERFRRILSALDAVTQAAPVFVDALLLNVADGNEDEAAKLGKDLDEIVQLAGNIQGLRARILSLIIGYLPKPDVVIDLVESNVQGGSITGANIWEANQICRQYVERGINPKFEHFIRNVLAPHIQDGDRLSLTVPEMIDFLKENYDPFSKQIANGLISRAGKLNEMLLERSLVNQGIGNRGVDYDVTGTQSQGDMVFYCSSTTPRRQMFAEVKSYGARERLLRGLQDLTGKDAIGVGFFINASEFNPNRTQTFIDTGTLAIYVPDTTFANINPASLARLSRQNQPFYRRLSDFPADIIHFVRNGRLP